jgi:predicted ATPase
VLGYRHRGARVLNVELIRVAAMLSEQYIAEVKLKRDEVPNFSIYPFCLDAVRNLTSIKMHPATTFIVGENGSGKSTLLEAIAVAPIHANISRD